MRNEHIQGTQQTISVNSLSVRKTYYHLRFFD